MTLETIRIVGDGAAIGDTRPRVGAVLETSPGTAERLVREGVAEFHARGTARRSRPRAVPGEAGR